MEISWFLFFVWCTTQLVTGFDLGPVVRIAQCRSQCLRKHTSDGICDWYSEQQQQTTCSMVSHNLFSSPRNLAIHEIRFRFRSTIRVYILKNVSLVKKRNEGRNERGVQSTIRAQCTAWPASLSSVPFSSSQIEPGCGTLRNFGAPRGAFTPHHDATAFNVTLFPS